MPWRRTRGHKRLSRFDTQIRYLQALGRPRRWAIWGICGLLGLAIAWIVVTGLVARADAQQIRTRLHQVQLLIKDGNIKGAEEVAAKIPALAHRAHKLTTGPAWWVASEVPYLGTPLEIARGTVAATDELGSQGISTLLDVAIKIDPAKLRTTGDTINLAPLAAAAPKLEAVSKVVHKALNTLEHTPSSSWFASVDNVHTSMTALMADVSGYVDAASRAAQVLPEMLGQDGPKRYFIAMQNEAEVRGTGGLPGAFAIVTADHGKLTFTHFESDQALTPHATGSFIQTGLDFGADYDQAYGAAQTTTLYVNGGTSPNFPYAAQIWATMWEKQTGEHIDGTMAIDPGVLANLLQATGPLMSKEGIGLNASSVVALTESQEYALFTNNNARRDFLVGVLKTVADAAIDGKAKPSALVQAMATSAKQHRALVWSSDPAIEKVIEQTDYSGVIPQTKQAFVGLVLNNEAAGKLDYYTQRSITYQSSGCGKFHDVTVTITLTNNAPGVGLPTYVTDRMDTDKPPNAVPGDNRTLVDYYATSGAQLESAEIDGQTSGVGVFTDLGHPIYRIDQELPHGKTVTIELHLIEPASPGQPLVWYQPGVNAMNVIVERQNC